MLDTDAMSDVGIKNLKNTYSTVTIHDDEPKLGIRFQQLRQSLGVEFVITEI